jgi:high-affinity K+ transport system ATPase subunit B
MEQALALAVMIADKSEGTSKIEFSKRFDLQNINELAPFTAQYRHAGVTYENTFEDHGVIKSIEEL